MNSHLMNALSNSAQVKHDDQNQMIRESYDFKTAKCTNGRPRLGMDEKRCFAISEQGWVKPRGDQTPSWQWN